MFPGEGTAELWRIIRAISLRSNLLKTNISKDDCSLEIINFRNDLIRETSLLCLHCCIVYFQLNPSNILNLDRAG